MTGERWPDKRARAVLYAGARKLANDTPDPRPDRVADLGLQVREFLFTDAEVREDNADPKTHLIGYSADCMQFATLRPTGDAIELGLWVGAETKKRAIEELAAVEDPNPLRNHFGWVRVPIASEGGLEKVQQWIQRARRHAQDQKSAQTASL